MTTLCPKSDLAEARVDLESPSEPPLIPHTTRICVFIDLSKRECALEGVTPANGRCSSIRRVYFDFTHKTRTMDSEALQRRVGFGRIIDKIWRGRPNVESPKGFCDDADDPSKYVQSLRMSILERLTFCIDECGEW